MRALFDFCASVPDARRIKTASGVALATVDGLFACHDETCREMPGWQRCQRDTRVTLVKQPGHDIAITSVSVASVSFVRWVS